MLWSLILQLMIDVLLVSMMVWLWLQQKKNVHVTGSKSLPTLEMQNRFSDLEKTVLDLRQSLMEEKRHIQNLHDRIQKLIEQGAVTNVIFPMSKEEEELKSLLPYSRNETEIPTLKDFEVTRERISQNTLVDLRTILRDQLA